MPNIRSLCHVNIPFGMLYDAYLEKFISHGLHPEIGLDAQALEGFSLSQFSRVAEKLHHHRRSITFHAPFLDLSPGSPDPSIWEATRRRYEQVLKLVPLFRPKTLVCHPAYDMDRYSHIRSAWVERSLELWGRVAKVLHNQGVRLVFENVYDHNPQMIRILLEELNVFQVGFCLDIGHHSVWGRCGMEDWLSSLGPFLHQLHLHDNHGEMDDHLSLGAGRIDFVKVFTLISSYDCRVRVMTLEPHREEDLWPSLAYLERNRRHLPQPISTG